HGSQLEYSTAPRSSGDPLRAQASRIAATSAWAVGSFVAVTRFTPSTSSPPGRRTTAPHGPPPPATLAVARAIVRCRVGVGSGWSIAGFLGAGTAETTAPPRPPRPGGSPAPRRAPRRGRPRRSRAPAA